jgi:hypothetical protein
MDAKKPPSTDLTLSPVSRASAYQPSTSLQISTAGLLLPTSLPLTYIPSFVISPSPLGRVTGAGHEFRIYDPSLCLVSDRPIVPNEPHPLSPGGVPHLRRPESQTDRPHSPSYRDTCFVVLATPP